MERGFDLVRDDGTVWVGGIVSWGEPEYERDFTRDTPFWAGYTAIHRTGHKQSRESMVFQKDPQGQWHRVVSLTRKRLPPEENPFGQP